MTDFNSDQFFDVVVRRLYDDPDKPLMRYGPEHPKHNAPLGSPIHPDYKREKSWGKATYTPRARPGEVCYLGDQPYTDALIAAHFFERPCQPLREPEPNISHVELNRKSIIGAIGKYIREEEFGAYLSYVLREGDASIEDEIRQCVKKRIEGAVRDDESPVSGALGPIYRLESDKVAEHSKNHARYCVAACGAVDEKFVERNPVLMGAIALFLGVQAEYLTQLEAAFERAGYLSDDERNIGLDVLRYSLDDFRNNLSFQVLLPLTMMHYKENKVAGEADQERMLKAIGKAVDSIQGLKIMHSDFEDAQGKTHSTFCPARSHLRHSWVGDRGGAGLMDTYAAIAKSPEKFQSTLDGVKGLISNVKNLGGGAGLSLN